MSPDNKKMFLHSSIIFVLSLHIFFFSDPKKPQIRCPIRTSELPKRFMADFKHLAMDACHGHWNYFSHCLSNKPWPWTPDSRCSESLINFLNSAWGDGQNMVLKHAGSTGTNGSGQQQVFTGIKTYLEKKNPSIYMASLFFTIKNPKNDCNHFLIRTRRYT